MFINFLVKSIQYENQQFFVTETSLISLETSAHLYCLFSFSFCSSFFKFSLDESRDFINFCLRGEELDHFTFGVNHEFAKVPWDLLCFVSFWIIEFTVVSEEDKKRMSVLSVHFYFLHHWELHIEVFSYELFDFFGRSTFLSKELIARKGQNFKSTVFPFFMSLDHFLVVFRGKTSLASNVDHHDEFPIFESLKVERLSSDVVNLEVKEAIGSCLSE